MCACKVKKSFFIEDILGESKGKEAARHGGCCRRNGARSEKLLDDFGPKIDVDEPVRQMNAARISIGEDTLTEKALEQRRNTYPLCPMPVKPGFAWGYKTPYDLSPTRQYAYYRESLPEQLLRNHFANMRFVPQAAALRHPYNPDRVSAVGWWGGGAGRGLWGGGGRRKGGQVRFSAAQTGALERRFATAKYLSPDERRALATSLRLSDRQVKTWYQNRRAKWRRTTTDGDDASPEESSPASDQDEPVQHQPVQHQSARNHHHHHVVPVTGSH